MPDSYPRCGLCPYNFQDRLCRNDQGKSPRDCPTLRDSEINQEALQSLKESSFFEFARQASIQECQGYSHRQQGLAYVRPLKPRIVELIEFAKKMDYMRLGLVFCIGLRKEGRIVHKILETNHFEVISVICKAGRISKKELDLTPEHHIDPNNENETMCNPIFQAYLLNHYRSQFNVLLGLCVGHDSLFIKHAQALSTVLAVKDRVFGHNPLLPVYQYEHYYRSFQFPLEDIE